VVEVVGLELVSYHPVIESALGAGFSMQGTEGFPAIHLLTLLFGF